MGDVRGWIRKGAGRSYRDLNGCLLLFRSCGLSYLHVIAGLVLFLGCAWWQIRNVSSVKSLFSKSVCTCYFLFRWLVNDRAEQGNINHTSWAVDVTLILMFYSDHAMVFSHTYRHTHTLTHTDILAQMGFHIWMPGAVVLALKTPITSVKHYGWLYWSFSAIMQYGHERWLNLNRMGKKEMMRPLRF